MKSKTINLIFLIILFLSKYVYSDVFLIYGGKSGWVGQMLMSIIKQQGHMPIEAESRLETRDGLIAEIKSIKPDYVINAAGTTGRPNVDWCEDHTKETILCNIIGALNLADVTCRENIPLINLGTGCIYEYDDKHPMYSGIGYTEEDVPNFRGSFYSHTKIMLDDLLKNYPNVLNLRIRMPISNDLHPRNFITKITQYAKVVNVPNSMTVLSDLLPLIPEMAKRGLRGNYNFVNPGTISHNEILDLYKKYVDQNFTYLNFSVEEQNSILKAERSNNELDVSKLCREFPNIPPIKESMVNVMKAIQASRGCC